MDMDQAAIFLAGSILTMVGLIVIVAGAVVINNMIHKYWKSFGWKFIPAALDQPPMRFAEPHELDKSREPRV
jgi:ascorbate-specific PTS system EIIC-type component UlaA